MYVIILSAIAPALILLYYIWRRDKYAHEPVKEILKAFGLGVLSVVPAVIFERLFQVLGIVPDSTVWYLAVWEAFVGVALIEEGCKLFFLDRFAKRSPYFDEYMDGIVYAVAVSMGFAATENILYLFGNIETWQSVAFARAIFSVPGHYMNAVAMGYYYSLSHFSIIRRRRGIYALIVPVILHGCYDALLMVADVTPAVKGVLFLIFVIFCLCMPRMAKRKINHLLETDRQNYEFEMKW